MVVRGGLLELKRLRRDAAMTFARFGEYGVSVLAVPDEAALDTIARTTLVKESKLTLMTAGAIRAIDLELRPTFRRPHYTVMLPDLDADLLRLIACENVVQENPALSAARGSTMTYAIDIYVDWNTQDDTGLPWSLASEAADPSRIVPGAYVIAGHDDAIAVVEVVDRDEQGVVHLRMLPGPISANAHLLHAPAS